MSEVASRAGVSPTTASLVLGGKADIHRISAETLQRVRLAADDLDYAPNLLVRSLQGGRTHILAFFNAFRHRRTNDLYMDRFSTAIENAAGRYGYDVLVNCDFRRPPEDTYQFLNGGRSDGLLCFAPLPDDPLLPLLRKSRMPVVLIMARDPGGVLPSVKDDVESGMRQVADALVRRGHRHIAAFTEEGSDFRDAHPRVAMLRSFLKEHGIEIPDHRVLPAESDLRRPLSELLQEPDPPTAIFCWRDHLAYYLLAACEELGIAVPEQLSVVGYDGLQWPAATRHVAASVRVDLPALADVSIRLLDRYIRGEETHIIEESLPVTLIPGTTLSTTN